VGENRLIGKVGILCVVLQFAIIGLVIACSCVTPDSPQIELSKFDAVFIGKVIRIEQAKPRGYSVKFNVLKQYKGNLDEFIVVRTGMGHGDCGYPFKENEEYFIYASSSADGFRVSLCSRTKKLSEAKEDRDAIEAIGFSLAPQ